MSKRLQVLFEEDELEEIREAARRQRLTVAGWVRQALRAARRDQLGVQPQDKLLAVREAAAHGFPTGDIEQMLSEIEQGYLVTDE